MRLRIRFIPTLLLWVLIGSAMAGHPLCQPITNYVLDFVRQGL